MLIAGSLQGMTGETTAVFYALGFLLTCFGFGESWTRQSATSEREWSVRHLCLLCS